MSLYVSVHYTVSHKKCHFYFLRPGNGSPSATNVVLLVVLPHGSVVSRPIVMKLFTRIDDNILLQAIVADF